MHVTLTNPQTFGFEFHKRSLPYTLNKQLALLLPALFFAVPPCCPYFGFQFFSITLVVPLSLRQSSKSTKVRIGKVNCCGNFELNVDVFIHFLARDVTNASAWKTEKSGIP